MNQILDHQHNLLLQTVSNMIDLHATLKSSNETNSNPDRIKYITILLRQINNVIDQASYELLSGCKLLTLTKAEREFVEEYELQQKIMHDLQPLYLPLIIKHVQKS